MSDDNKDLKLVFAPGFFDEFDGTQEELDQLVQEIKKTFMKGDWLEEATPIDFDNDGELVNFIESIKVESIKPKRTYH